MLSALFFGVFAAASYQSIYLMEIGMSGQQIGCGMALGSLAGLIVLPVWGMLSDYLGSSRKIFMLCMMMCGILFFLFPGIAKSVYPYVVWIYGYVILTVIFKQPANAMLDSWTVSELAGSALGYGTVRKWGSIGYSVVSVILGIVIGKYVKTDTAFYLVLAFVVPILFLSVQKEQKKERRKSGKKEKPDLKKIWKNQTFLVYLIYTLGLNIYLSVTLIFMGYILEAAGCPATLIGVMTGYRALMEILSMQFCEKMRQRFSLTAMLLISGILFAAEQLWYGQYHGMWMLFPAMTFSGLAGGIFYSMGPSYIYEVSDPQVRNTAQSLGAVTLSLTGIAGTALGGSVIEKAGIHALTNGCGIFILMLTVMFGIYNRKQWKKVTA